MKRSFLALWNTHFQFYEMLISSFMKHSCLVQWNTNFQFYEMLICRREKNKVSHLWKCVVIKFYECHFSFKTEKNTRKMNPTKIWSYKFVKKINWLDCPQKQVNFEDIYTIIWFLEIRQYLIFDDKLISIFSFPIRIWTFRDHWLRKLWKSAFWPFGTRFE